MNRNAVIRNCATHGSESIFHFIDKSESVKTTLPVDMTVLSKEEAVYRAVVYRAV